ncbi:fumarylacetoacetate hydrolase family protein [Mesotoga sp.]|uniref:fumarylacetoacetate hydrolase family protein n=1 Tax=Mesotoga sp. TaxID=2053577 RepID=UPI00345EAE72
MHIGRFRDVSMRVFWGIVERDLVTPLDVKTESTGSFFKTLEEIPSILQNLGSNDRVNLSDLEVLSPITSPCRIICQGKNYLDHLLDTGIREEDKKYNMFFNKSSASVNGPSSPIVRPRGVRLLDYEVELGLVMKASIDRAINVDFSHLHEYIGGIVIGNDISARDIQLPQSQFFKGKSYRTFCPFGPFIFLMGRNEMKYLESLTVELKVNGVTKQRASTSNMIYKPWETLSELSEFSDLEAGDVILTGTPKGTALSQRKGLRTWLRRLLSESKRWEIFIREQEKGGRYLVNGDVIESRIFSSDGRIDLGVQRNRVVDEEEIDNDRNYL